MANTWANLKKAVNELKDGNFSMTLDENSIEVMNDVKIADSEFNNLPVIRKKSLITEGMDIVGDIHLADTDIEIFGKIKGNIDCNGGSVYISSQCFGNTTAQCIFLNHNASVTGNLEARDVIQIDEGCVLKGDVKTLGSVSVKGSMVGNIETHGDIYLGANSVINGDITSTSIEITKGAKLNGTVKMTSSKKRDADEVNNNNNNS